MQEYYDPEAPAADEQLLQFAVRTVAEAGALALERFFADPAIRRKGDGTPVSDADIAVAEHICSALHGQFPADGIEGEELKPIVGNSGNRWIVDPIGGTSAFIRRQPIFYNYLAFEDRHGPAIGLINMPISGQLIAAGRRLGCRLHDDPRRRATAGAARPVHVSRRHFARGARVQAFNLHRWPESLLVAFHRRVALAGCTGGIIDLVTGRADAVVVAGPPMGYDDVAPVPILVTEAGGRVSDLDGASVLTGDMTGLASNGLIHDELLDLAAGHPRCRETPGAGTDPSPAGTDSG